MPLPGFLRRDPSENADLPDACARRGHGHATRGCILGCSTALFLWCIPIPVAAIVWAFDLKGPFGDYMLMAIPFLLALPIIGAGISQWLGRRNGTRA